jgi:prepilin-type N-terminal cleavage/methylation domain-containing protein
MKGFTLIELLIAIGVFTILVAIGVGGFVHALHTQREVAALIAAQSNASIALEQMAREIRTGYLFCTAGGTNPAVQNAACQPQGNSGCTILNNVWTCKNILDFYNANGNNVDYELANGTLERSQTGSNGYTAITGDNVNVSNLTFTIFGNTEGDNWPPRITISMGVVPSSTDPAVASDTVSLQTTISARQIDCTSGSPAQC